MTYSSLINNPAYASLFNSDTVNFIKSPTVQSYVSNNPTTIYSLANAYVEAVNTLDNLPANNGTTTTFTNVLRLAAPGGDARILIPAGTYDLTMKVRVNVVDTAPANMTYGALVVYNASDPVYNDGFSVRLLVSSSVSFVQSVASALTYANINETQRIILTVDTYLGMIFEYSNSVGLHKVVTGVLPTDNIDYTPSITLKPTI